MMGSRNDALQCSRQFELPSINREIDCIQATTIDLLIGESTTDPGHSLTAKDLGFNALARLAGQGPANARKRGMGKGSAGAAPKFQDGQGNSWGGRGPRPAWLRAALASGRTLQRGPGARQTAGVAGSLGARCPRGPSGASASERPGPQLGFDASAPASISPGAAASSRSSVPSRASISTGLTECSSNPAARARRRSEARP